MLEFQNLQMRSGGFELNADDKIEAGQIIAVIGPSGSGKSTLLNAIAGFTEIVSGSIVWNGVKLHALQPSQRSISMIFQNHNLFPRMSMRENIKLGGDSILDDKLLQVCANLGIEGLLDRFPRQISGGQGARAAIARAILQNNDIWLLDEPLAALGPKQNREIRAFLRETIHKTNKIALIVSHSPNEMVDFADKIIWIGNENVNPAVETEAFFDNPPELAAKYL